MHGDQHRGARGRSTKVRFLHPKGWTYFDTLRQKTALERRSGDRVPP